MKQILLSLIICCFGMANNITAQNIFGIAGNKFISFNLTDKSKDTLITTGQFWPLEEFPSAIDRFNGRYFFGGSISGLDGGFHVINLEDLSIESLPIKAASIEYNFIRNQINYVRNDTFYSIDLNSNELTNLGKIRSGPQNAWGQYRTYIPQTNQFFCNEFSETSSNNYFLLIDADTGEINCKTLVQESEFAFGITGNNFTGEIIGHGFDKYGIVNACEGKVSSLFSPLTNDYAATLNRQMAVYNHKNNTYIEPYVANNPASREFKYAIMDLYNQILIDTFSQPWNGQMNLQQIYDQPIAPLINLNDTLFVPFGIKYKWFLNDKFIVETSSNFLIPEKNGRYKAEVEFREYSTFSTEVEINSFTNEIIIYPNPSMDYLNIDFPDCEQYILQVFDITGKLIQNSVSNFSFKAQIKTTNFPQGHYIIRIESRGKVIANLFTKY